KTNALFFLGAFLCLPTIVSAQKAGDDKASLERLASGDRRALKDVIKQGDAILPELTKLLAKPRDENQSLLVFAVAEIAQGAGAKAKGATPILCTLLKSQDKGVASDAARALGYIGADAVPEVVKTLKALKDEPELMNAIRALGRIGPGAKGAAPELVSVMKASANPHYKLACVEALGAIGPSGKETVDALLDAGKNDKKNFLKAHLIVALGNQGADGKAAVPYLVEVIKEGPEPHFRVHALEALVKISPASKETSEAVAKM